MGKLSQENSNQNSIQIEKELTYNAEETEQALISIFHNNKDLEIQIIRTRNDNIIIAFKPQGILSNNEDLNALYWISKDFYDPKVKSTNPDAERLIKLRHALEHRYVVIQEDYLSPPTEKKDDSEKINHFVEYISEEELHNRTLSLLQLTREAILTIAMAVKKEESERNQDLKGEKAQIVIPKYEDQWKV